MPVLLYLQGRLNLESYAQACIQHQIAPEQTVFIFPGNPSHHSPTQTLFSVKVGGGLAAVAYELGKHGIPTLSLPTTGMGSFADPKYKALAERCVADVWRAAGFGLNLALPVRAHVNNQYFDNSLNNKNPENLEPSFWGGIERTANKALGNFYLSQLNLLYDFFQHRDKQLENLAFQEGEQARMLLNQNKPIPAWFSTNEN